MNDIIILEPATQTSSVNITEKAILNKTHYGLTIYSHILRKYYNGSTALQLFGKECKPTRNPFLKGDKTLNIFLSDGAFVFQDLNNPDFNGNPFDFAERHYNKSGNELLHILNSELHLNIGKVSSVQRWTPNFINPILDKKVDIDDIPKISFFNCPVSNIYPTKKINLLEVYQIIGHINNQDTTDQLRSINDPKKARAFKAKHFDYVTFSGTFSKRADNDLINHSGLLTIDFDHIPNLNKLKEDLLVDEYFDTELMFVSPSGDGLKWIIPIDLTVDMHLNYFNSISSYIKQTYNLEIDKSGKDISRACFLCYDKDVYINPKYII